MFRIAIVYLLFLGAALSVPAYSDVTVLSQSRAVAAPITMTSQFLDPVEFGSSSCLQLSFQLPAAGTLVLAIADQDQLDIAGLQSNYSTDTSGALVVELVVTPQRSGKLYLKFIATAEINGQSASRPFVVVVPVSNAAGDVPATEKSYKGRVDLPARRI